MDATEDLVTRSLAARAEWRDSYLFVGSGARRRSAGPVATSPPHRDSVAFSRSMDIEDVRADLVTRQLPLFHVGHLYARATYAFAKILTMDARRHNFVYRPGSDDFIVKGVDAPVSREAFLEAAIVLCDRADPGAPALTGAKLAISVHALEELACDLADDPSLAALIVSQAEGIEHDCT
jgi:hypothetical protein